MQGASSGGVAGLAKGVGKGVVGLIAKPAVGIIDLGTHTLQGLRDQAGMYNTHTHTHTLVLVPFLLVC